MLKMKPKYDISIGDKFYFNNYSTKRGHTLPDYLIVTGIRRSENDEIEFITAKYENHGIHTVERTFSPMILDESNLNPLTVNPEWIFLNRSQVLQMA